MPNDDSLGSLDISQITESQGKDVVAGSNASVAAILKSMPSEHSDAAKYQGSEYSSDSCDSSSVTSSSKSRTRSSSQSSKQSLPSRSTQVSQSQSSRRQSSNVSNASTAVKMTGSSSTTTPKAKTPSSATNSRLGSARSTLPHTSASSATAASPPSVSSPLGSGTPTDVDAEVQCLRKEVARLEAEVMELKEENFMWSMKANKEERGVMHLSISQLKFDDAVQVCSKEEFEALKKDVLQQDALITAYQKENEKLTAEVKDLRKQLNDAKEAVYTVMAKKPAVMHEESHATGLQAKEWKLKYDRLSKEFEVREGEWKAEFEALKRQKKEIETRFAGFDWEKNCNDTLEIRRLKAELKQQEVKHQNQVDALESQIKWYIENQEMITKNDELVSAQAQTIDNLRQRVLELENGSKEAGRGEAGLKARYYQKRISELEEALRKAEKGQKDDGIPALIRAVKPLTEETQQIKMMQRKIQQLQQELDEQTSKSEKALRVLRLESDRLKTSYETRITQMEDDMKMRLKAASSKKVQELTRQLDDMRTYYAKKVRELETQVIQLRRELKGQGRGGYGAGRGKGAPAAATSPGGPGRAAGNPPSAATEQSVAVEGGRSQGTQTTLEMSPTIHQGQAAVQGDGSAQLLAENHHLREELSQLSRKLAAAEIALGRNTATRQTSTEIEVLHQQLAAAQADAAAHRQIAARAQDTLHRTQLEQTERLQEVLQEQQRAHDQLVVQHRQELQRVTEEYAQELKALRERQQMFGLAEGSGADRVSYLQCVAVRLEALEQHCWLREREVQRTLEETKRMADFELQVEKQKLQLLLQMKNNEIERFRMELDSLLEQFHALVEVQGD